MIDAAEQRREAIQITPNHVITILKCIGNFIGFMSRKVSQHLTVADISCLGTVVRNNNNGALDFYPNQMLSSETKSTKQMPAKIQEQAHRLELSMNKLALVS